MKQSDFFRKFKDVEKGGQKELNVDRRVRILWIDPWDHTLNLNYFLEKILEDSEKRAHPEKGWFSLRNHYSMRGKIDSLDCCVEIYQMRESPEKLPEAEFDICIVSRKHGGPSSESEEEQVRKEIEPYLDLADYMIYRNCCHEKGALLAARFGPSHIVSADMAYQVAAEMAMDLLRGETEYAECGSDFKKAAELAEQRGDERKQKLYEKWEELKFK